MRRVRGTAYLIPDFLVSFLVSFLLLNWYCHEASAVFRQESWGMAEEMGWENSGFLP